MRPLQTDIFFRAPLCVSGFATVALHYGGLLAARAIASNAPTDGKSMSNPLPVPSAHSALGPAGPVWHRLDQHLIEVARRAADNAAPFGSQDWARLAGLWHDLGKYRPAFQRYLRAANGIAAEDAHIEGGAGRVSHFPPPEPCWPVIALVCPAGCWPI